MIGCCGIAKWSLKPGRERLGSADKFLGVCERIEVAGFYFFRVRSGFQFRKLGFLANFGFLIDK
jgi:hypothetical protein